MSNYTKTTDFAAKDSLPTGDSGKIIRGAEFENEFDAISTAIATKADKAGPTFTGTLTFATLSDGAINVTAFVDEDNMASDSATLVPTQQSVKAYVDSVTTELQAQDLDFQADSGGALSIDLDTETMTFTGGTGIDTSGSVNTVTFAIDSTVTTLTGTQTLTNKTLTSPDVNTPDIDGGTIDGATIATSDITVGTGKTLDVSGGTLTLADDQISGDKVEGGTIASTTITSLASTTVDTTNLEVTNIKAKDGTSAGSIADTTGVVTLASSVLTTTDINGGTIDGATIGGTTAAAGSFTTVSATGNITVDGTVDGRDVATDGTKLDGIEASADVTDTTNVTAAGALMDSELTDITAVKSLDQGVATTDSPTFAGLTTTADVSFGDNDKAIFGAGSDLQIYHDGSNSRIQDTGTGNLKLVTDGASIQLQSATENMVVATPDADVQLYFNGLQKLATTSTGIDVTGNTESDTVTIGTSSVAGSEKLRVNGTVLTLGGSVSAPAIGVGDTNTGVYAPTAGQLGWTVNGQQRLFLDSTGVDVTGSVTADEVDLATKAVIQGATPRIELFESDTTDVNTRIRNTGGELQIQSTDDAGTTSKSRIVIDHATGDISFREDTGSTAKLYWDASEESLGIGTTSPAEALHVAGNIRFGDTAPSELYTNSSELRLGVDKNNDNDTSNITFYANDSEKVRIDKDGHLIVPNGLTLGVAVDAYAAAKTLDDYEEGTFIPVIADASSGGNTGTATTAEGFYTKIGRQVVVVIKIEDIDTTGMTGANNIFIRGLPFVSASGAAGQSQGSLRLDRADLDANCCGIVCSSTSNSSYLTLRQTVDNSADVQIKVQDFTSGSADLFATITYFV